MMEAIARLTWMEVKLFFREKTAVFWTFLFPVLIIWLFGSVFGDQEFAGFRFVELYVPAWVGVNLSTIALFGLGTVLTEYRQKGILRRYQATPLGPVPLLVAQAVCGLLIFLVSAAVILIFGMVMYDLSFPAHPWSVLAALVLSILAIFPFGMWITSLAKTSRAASAISSVVFNGMLFLSGAAFPLAMMPELLQQVAKVLPLYYVIDLLQQTWSQAPIQEQGTSVMVLSVLIVVFSLLAAKCFRWDASDT